METMKNSRTATLEPDTTPVTNGDLAGFAAQLDAERPVSLFKWSSEEDDRLLAWCERVVKGKFAPKDMSVEAAYCAATFGAELGLGPWASIQNISVINGRPAVLGPTPLSAIVQRSGLLVGGVAPRGVHEE